MRWPQCPRSGFRLQEGGQERGMGHKGAARRDAGHAHTRTKRVSTHTPALAQRGSRPNAAHPRSKHTHTHTQTSSTKEEVAACLGTGDSRTNVKNTMRTGSAIQKGNVWQCIFTTRPHKHAVNRFSITDTESQREKTHHQPCGSS